MVAPAVSAFIDHTIAIVIFVANAVTIAVIQTNAIAIVPRAKQIKRVLAQLSERVGLLFDGNEVARSRIVTLSETLSFNGELDFVVHDPRGRPSIENGDCPFP